MKNIINHYEKNKLQILVVVLSLTSISLLLFYGNLVEEVKKKEIEIKILKEKFLPCDSLKMKLDSVNSELLILETELTRHEITREEIFFKHPKIKEEYEYFITNFTE
jgi:hypothetical protein